MNKGVRPMNVLFRKSLIPGALVLVAALGVGLPACSAQDHGKKTDNQVLAVVNGKAITEADIRQANADQFKALDREYQSNLHQLMETSLQTSIQDRLVEAEAASRKVTKEQVLAEIKPATVTDAEVDAFYEQNKAQIPKPKDQV